MPKIRRNEFIEARQERQLDLAAAKADPAFRAQVLAAGFTLDDLDKLDFADHDGVLRGPRELRALFNLLKTAEGGGAKDSLEVKSRPWAPSRADKAFDAFESRFEASTQPPAPAPRTDAAARARFPLAGPVGPKAANRKEDVLLVQARLREVGLDVGADGQFGPKTERALQTYRAMLEGLDETKEEPGRIELNDVVDRAFGSAEPPRWVKMPERGAGFVNDDVDGYGFGSAETKAVIEEAGAAYAKDYLSAQPKAAPMGINDVSKGQGGLTPDHESHQNGLDLDVRLPRTDGTNGSDVRWANYDREATYAMLTAFAANPRVERVLFADAELLARAKNSGQPWAYKVQDGGPVHRNHLHVDVKPPKVTPG
jgi:peptidoglycan hydrolase-like protein with peptidoglycan-binding domain